MPCWIVIFLIAFAMLSLAMARQPCAISSGLRHTPVARTNSAPSARTHGGAPPGLRRELGEAPPDDLGVERLVGVRAEHAREELGQQLADHQDGVGDGERAAPPGAGRARVCARAL